jgi:putative transferase (TIGR04331 family)
VLYNLDTMDHAAAWRLAVASGLRVAPLGPCMAEPPTPAVLDDRRSGLGALDAEEGFERAAVRCLPYYLPTVFLEGYGAARQRILAGWRHAPRVIVSTTGWSYDEPFKLFAAEAADAGSRLVAVQHGGGYGVAREWPSELFERRLSDTFVTWGWADGPGTGLSNLPNPRLSQFCAGRRSRRGGSVQALFIAAGEKRYLTRFNSSPLASLDEEYLDGQLRFLESLTHNVRRSIRFRPHPGTGHPLRKLITDKHGEVKWDQGGSLYQSMDRARLVVIDHPVTSMLESLAADIPTVLFWDPRYWEMRPEAEPYFDALRSASILHDSPEAAAAHFSAVVDDVQAWWQDVAVQQAREAFARQFALTAQNWSIAWLAGIRAEVAAARAAATVREREAAQP